MQGVVGARADDDGDAAADAIDDPLCDGVLFFVAQRRGLGRRAEGDDAVGAVFQVEVDQFIQLVKVGGALRVKGGDKGDKGAAEGANGLLHEKSSFLVRQAGRYKSKASAKAATALPLLAGSMVKEMEISDVVI